MKYPASLVIEEDKIDAQPRKKRRFKDGAWGYTLFLETIRFKYTKFHVYMYNQQGGGIEKYETFSKFCTARIKLRNSRGRRGGSRMVRGGTLYFGKL